MLSCISFFDFIPVELRNRRVCQWMTLHTKQAEDTPSSLSKSDRIDMVR